MKKYHEERNYDGIEIWYGNVDLPLRERMDCPDEKEWTVLQKIVVATILIAALLGAGYLETFFLNLPI